MLEKYHTNGQYISYLIVYARRHNIKVLYCLPDGISSDVLRKTYRYLRCNEQIFINSLSYKLSIRQQLLFIIPTSTEIFTPSQTYLKSTTKTKQP